MARFTLLITTWKKRTGENWVTMVRRETENTKG